MPRFAPGLALLTGGIGFALGSDSLNGAVIAGLVIVELAALGLILSAGIDRSERVMHIRRHDANAEGARQFGRELMRARRHETPLALVRLPDAVAGGGSDARRRIAAARRHLRRIDVVWVRGRDVVLVLPETDGVTAATVIERLRSLVPSVLAGVEPKIAAFPEDGLTAGALLAAIEGRPLLVPNAMPAPAAPALPVARDVPHPATAAMLPPSPAAVVTEVGGSVLTSPFSTMSALAERVVDREHVSADLR
jgi:hypothetical protein